MQFFFIRNARVHVDKSLHNEASLLEPCFTLYPRCRWSFISNRLKKALNDECTNVRALCFLTEDYALIWKRETLLLKYSNGTFFFVISILKNIWEYLYSFLFLIKSEIFEFDWYVFTVQCVWYCRSRFVEFHNRTVVLEIIYWFWSQGEVRRIPIQFVLFIKVWCDK